MPVAGAIAERTRGIIPVTWDALAGDPRYGDGLLRTTVDTVKDSLFGRVVAPSAESGYPLRVIDFAAKLVAIELCTPGIDFWMNQPSSESATGTSEQHTFVDRADKLALLRKELLIATRQDAAEIGTLIANLTGYVRASRSSAPALSTMDDDLLTPSPQEFPRPFARTNFS